MHHSAHSTPKQELVVTGRDVHAVFHNMVILHDFWQTYTNIWIYLHVAIYTLIRLIYKPAACPPLFSTQKGWVAGAVHEYIKSLHIYLHICVSKFLFKKRAY